MLPDHRQDRSALRWIRGELDQNLRQVRASLEEFADGEQARLDTAAELLHHVHGALEMVQVYGGAMLADEMERLARAMSDGQTKRPDAASEALMLGLVQLPAYLEKVEAGGADVPLVLLPLMNDLRAAREAPLVSETSLFAPKLNALIAAETVRPGSGNREMPRLIQQHRSQYHRGLLNFIRNQQVRPALHLMRDVLDVLNSAAGTARFRRLLDAAEALATALADDDEEPALAVKPLFGKLDQVFKRVIDQGEEAAMLDFPVELLKNLLYYIARSSSRDPAVLSVQQSADLVNSFPDQAQGGAAVGTLGAPDREMFDAVGEALAQDLRDVKDQLDLYIRSDRNQLDRLTGLALPIQRIGDTLGMVGRGELRTRLKRFSAELDTASETASAPPEERLMALAGELLFVESSLASLGSDQPLEAEVEEPIEGSGSQMLSAGEMRQHQHAAIDEALVEVAKIKDDILEYFAQSDLHRLNEVPSRLQTVAGVMAMLEMAEAGQLLQDLVPYFAALSNGAQAEPDTPQRDALADVIMAAELYMQSAIEPGSDRDQLLGYAVEALQVLGLRQPVEAAPVADEAQAQPESVDTPVTAVETEVDATVAESVATVDEVVEPPVPVESVEVAAPPEEPLAEVEPVAMPAADEPEPLVAGAAPAVEHVIEQAADTSTMDTADAAVAGDAAADVAVAEAAESAAATSDGIEETSDVDSEILEIFAEEAEEELDSIQRCLPAWRSDQADKESLTTMRRSFHTLKGSGRIVGASNIGEFAWSVENLLNRVIDGTIDVSPDLLTLIDEVGEVLPTLVAEARDLSGPDTDVAALSERAFALASGEAAPAAAAEPEAPAELPEMAPVAADEVAEAALEAAVDGESLQLPEDEFAMPSIDDDVLAEPVFAESQAPLSLEGFDEPGDEQLTIETIGEGRPAAASVVDGAPPDESILTATHVTDSEFAEHDTHSSSSNDTSLNAVFLSEARGHLNVLDEFVQRCAATPGGCVMEAGVRRAMHTLRGSSRTAGADAMAELAAALENYCEALQYQQRQTDGRALDLLNRSHTMLNRLAAALDDAQREDLPWQEIRDEVDGEIAALTEPTEAADGDTGGSAAAQAFDPELLEIFLDEAKELLEALESELNDWEHGAHGDAPVVKLQRNLHTMKGGSRLAGVATVGDLSHALESAFESVVEGRLDGDQRLKRLVRHATDELAQDIEYLIRGDVPEAHPLMIERLEAAAHGRDWSDIAADEVAIDDESSFVPSSLQAGDVESADVEQPLAEPVDVDRLDALSEPQVDGAPSLLDELSAEPESEAVAEPEPEPAAVVDADIEPAFEAESVLNPDDEGESADSLALTESQLMTDSELLEDSSFLLVPEANEGGDDEQAADTTVVQFPGGEVLPDGGEGFVPRKPLPEEPVVPQTGSERVRVASEALDQMVNNAGEVSIYRARIEQQNGSVAFNLTELQQTIDRLRSQLRGLELETEAQILSRHERDNEARADFDPLELDRYSTIQQLSRALSETVDDLSNLGRSLNDLSRDTDTLLLQQARVTTDLQDGLLRTRMVRFASRVPRLERVVRQTSHSVGKRADLEVVGGEQDMDRAILERMMGPLEHLLRNAVSHGIEDAETRKSADKPEHGLITLQLVREGTDIVLTLSDDGAGLDRSRIRAKAVERGLIEDDAQLDDDDLFQLILQPGFSTAQELSQVSGRGVGMDVVLTEVKQLGGTLDIDSQLGYGSSFTIRLPFTLAITDALLVTVGDDYYAVPHSSMDGVARVGVDELRAIYAGQQDTFSNGGREYTVRYLGSMLGTATPSISDGARWMPLLLVRSGEHRVAIHVDGLLGNRQIVVKSIGAQLSGVRWFTGGTILADGQIALILDTNSLVRMDSTHQAVITEEPAEPVSKGVSVMVVDDSITVRKVTSRLLERHNMHVFTAKDGVDAVTQLQETQPDVMLLDIEMPRMDGFELARHMRSTDELRDIPIIMITSRTGDKHRERALELGVKRYLGKPYQEADLLENIYTVLADAAL